MAVKLDLDEVDSVLRREWNRVRNDAEPDYVDDPVVQQKIRAVLRDDRYGTMTFKYMLVANVLAKAVNPDVHYLALQVESDLPGCFNSRSIADDVLSDWDKDNGERLGGSNEPGTSKPYRHEEVDPSNAASIQDALDRLHEILSYLQENTEDGELDPMNVLRHTLYEVSELEPQTVDYVNPSDVPYRELAPVIREYLEISGGGERLASVTAGAVDAYYDHAGEGDWVVKAEHVNIPDEQSDAAGDVEVFYEDEDDLRLAYEVKDKPATKADIQHAIRKAREHELGEYLFVLGEGWRSEDERQGAYDVIDDAPIELILVSQEEVVQMLKFVGDGGRSRFTEQVGEYLNEMRAQEESKSGWKELMESL